MFPKKISLGEWFYMMQNFYTSKSPTLNVTKGIKIELSSNSEVSEKQILLYSVIIHSILLQNWWSKKKKKKGKRKKSKNIKLVC